MPELPEVEALAAFLRERASGHAVARADVAAISVLKTYDPPPASLTGLVVGEVTRHGKFLDLSPARPGGTVHLIVHLARAGWLRWRERSPAQPPKPGKGPLAFRVILGRRVRLRPDRGRDAEAAGRLPGPRPARRARGRPARPGPAGRRLHRRTLAKLLAGRRTQIKGVLRDQYIIAGIGNAYSDEVLHAAKMSPFKMAATLTAGRGHGAVRGDPDRPCATPSHGRVGLAAGDLKAEKKTGLKVHGKTGQACPVCGDTIREVSFADSSLQYCPTCQTGGKPLADRRLSRLLK